MIILWNLPSHCLMLHSFVSLSRPTHPNSGILQNRVRFLVPSTPRYLHVLEHALHDVHSEKPEAKQENISWGEIHVSQKMLKKNINESINRRVNQWIMMNEGNWEGSGRKEGMNTTKKLTSALTSIPRNQKLNRKISREERYMYLKRC